MIKILIVDDSALMRRHLAAVFEAEGGFEIGLARNGKEAVEENRAFKPDVVTLDINMPEMDGLTALALLMAERPVPVVMVSSLTEKGALASFEALALGAVDYIAKPDGTISLSIDAIRCEIIDKVRAAYRAKPKSVRGGKYCQRSIIEKDRKTAKKHSETTGSGVVVIGVSTGGPRTLEDILPQLPEDFPWPILVAQHMPASFTLPFANRMNDLCRLQVTEASKIVPLEAGTIYIAKGGADAVLTRRSGRLSMQAKPEAPEYLWHPSVELLGRSVLGHYEPAQVIAVMLTGMGNDGADAFAEIRKKGGRTIAESEASSVVFGMPAELIKRGGATVVLDSGRIADQIAQWAG